MHFGVYIYGSVSCVLSLLLMPRITVVSRLNSFTANILLPTSYVEGCSDIDATSDVTSLAVSDVILYVTHYQRWSMFRHRTTTPKTPYCTTITTTNPSQRLGAVCSYITGEATDGLRPSDAVGHPAKPAAMRLDCDRDIRAF